MCHLQNNENHGILIIHIQNHEDHENLIIPPQNHEKYEIHKIKTYSFKTNV